MILQKTIIKIVIPCILIISANRTFSQEVILENNKLIGIYNNLESYFKYSITNGYNLDTLYSNDGKILLEEKGGFYFQPGRTGVVKIHFLIRNAKGDTILVEKKVISKDFPNPHLVFSNGNRQMEIGEYNLSNLDSIHYIRAIWQETHTSCSIKSFKILILMKDSSTKLFSCYGDTFSKEFYDFLVDKRFQIEEIVLFNIRLKTAIGEMMIEPVHFH